MTEMVTRLDELPHEWLITGGRYLSAMLLMQEMPPLTPPLAPESKLVFAGGALAGTLAPSCGRISVGGKSPLTLGIKEANAGGPTAQKLDRLGFRGIVVEGRPKDDALYVLEIAKDQIAIRNAGDYAGMKNYELTQALRREYGDQISIASIGIAGERGLKSAVVTFTDRDGLPSRHAARGGLGAVMGAKGLKAIVIDDTGCPSVTLKDRESFRSTLKRWPAILKKDALVERWSQLGTPSNILGLRALGSMPSKNYSNEPTEGFEALSGEALKELNEGRGGGMHGCMPGCLVKCSIVYHGLGGTHLTSSYEYETIAMLGTNLGVVDPDKVALMDRTCDDLGIDTIEVGSALGVAASAGKMQMGDAEAALGLLDEIERNTDFGKVLGNGVVSVCKALGVSRIPAFKGQAIPAHDPRVCKAVGVTYVTSPMGADHTAGISYNDPTEKGGKVQDSFSDQVRAATIDALGYCVLAVPMNADDLLSFLADLINARYGMKLTSNDLVELGEKTLRTELAFNRGTEFHTAHDPDPDFIRHEPLSPTGSTFDVEPSEMKKIWTSLE
jgi:aldehyde:ferredoxin oxidoreductase